MTDENETPNPILKKMMSLSQFKSWLEGVEEMQDADWHPSASQWKTIRDKFDLIAEPKAPAPAPRPAPVAPLPMPAYHPPAGTPSGWPAAAPAAPAEAMDMTPAARAVLKGKTPEIDTTDGSYDSSFE